MAQPSIAFYGQIPAEFGCKISRSPGVIPDAITMVIREEDAPRISPTATVTLVDEGRTYSLPNCRAVAVDFISPGKVRLTVLDRRWRWRDGLMDLVANTPNGTILEPSTITSTDDIVRHILVALGEQRFDTRGIAGYGFPEVAAEGQKPADVLLELVERLGVEPIIDNQDAIRFVPVQFSPTLPRNQRVLNSSIGYQFETGPDYWVYRAGTTLFQQDYVLEAVGKEPTGEIKPIEELSYKPKDGWAEEDPRDFGGVDVEYRGLARETVFRWYRIKLPVDLPRMKFAKDTPSKVKTAIRRMLKVKEDERWRILPMGTDQVAPTGDAPDHISSLPEAIVIGRYWMGGNAPQHNADAKEIDGNTRDKPNIVVIVPRSIDEFQGIVKFAEPIYELDEQFDKMLEPRLTMRVGLGLRDRESGSFLRQDWYFKARSNPIGTLPGYIQDDSIHYVIWDQYEPKKKRGLTNEKDFAEAAVLAIRNKLKDVRPQRPETWEYDGMQLIEPGGRVRQVRYEYGEGGPLVTTIALDDPALPDVPTLAEQQLYRGVNSWIASQRRSRRRRAKRTAPGNV